MGVLKTPARGPRFERPPPDGLETAVLASGRRRQVSYAASQGCSAISPLQVQPGIYLGVHQTRGRPIHQFS